MNFVDLQDRLAFVLNFNDGQADQDFSSTRLKQALNFVYAEEVHKAQQEGGRRWFREFTDITWTASSVTYTLPASIDAHEVLRFVDITDTNPGTRLQFSPEGLSGDLHVRDRKTLQWGTSGPASDRTIRVFYYALPVDMVADLDEPELIPDSFREILVWAAAVRLRVIGDEEAPRAWVTQLNTLREDYWKAISRGWPMDEVTTIAQAESDVELGDPG